MKSNGSTHGSTLVISTNGSHLKRRLVSKQTSGDGPELPTIVEIEPDKKDLYYLSPLQRISFYFLPVSTIAWMSLSVYYCWVQSQVINAKANKEGWSRELGGRQWTMWIDTICTIPWYTKMLADSLSIVRHKVKPRLRAIGDNVPPIDIVIVCCKEPLSVILDTVRAAASIDYPDNKCRLLVSDDGGQKEVEDGVRRIQKDYPQRFIFYTARVRTANNSHKAGNLNHAFEYFARLPGGAAPYLAGIDADMMVEKHWLRAQIPILLQEPRMAFTCPPPRFYNGPTIDPLSQSLLVFQRYDELVKDGAGFPWCTGSGWLMRRAAIDSIGGFPDGSLTEDLLCSNMLLGKGWSATYVMETLQWGMVPDSYHAHVQQRRRWSTGALQTGFLMRMCLFGSNAQHMGLWQRVMGFWYPVQTSSATLGVLGALNLLYHVCKGWPLVIYSDPKELKLLLQLGSLASLMYYLRLCKLSVISGMAATMRELVSSQYLTGYFAYDHWKTFLLPTWLGGRAERFSARFRATGSIIDELNERNPKLRAPLHRRLWSAMIRDGAIFPTIFAFAYIYGIGTSIRQGFLLHQPGGEEFYRYLLTHAFWVPLTWPLNICMLLRPLYVILFPLEEADRADLLVYDEHGVASPREEAKFTKWTGLGLGMELYWTVNALYCLGLFISTFYWE